MRCSPRAQVGTRHTVRLDPRVLRGDPVAELGFEGLPACVRRG
jgi:hypothetical protein